MGTAANLGVSIRARHAFDLESRHQAVGNLAGREVVPAAQWRYHPGISPPRERKTPFDTADSLDSEETI